MTKSVNQYATAANIYLYASEMNRTRPRLARHASPPLQIQPEQPQQPDENQNLAPAVTIIRAIHSGNWNPEPLALDLFAAAMADRRHMIVAVKDSPLEAIDQISPRPALVIVCGIEKQEFTAQQTDAIRKYVAAGAGGKGLILFETPGGRGEFTLAAEQMATTLFNSQVHSLLRSRIITGEGLDGAANLSRVEYGPYALEVFAARETAPRLRGIEIDGQLRILFSREDITHALLDETCWGICGYSPQSARDLLANIVLHATAVESQKGLTTEDTVNKE